MYLKWRSCVFIFVGTISRLACVCVWIRYENLRIAFLFNSLNSFCMGIPWLNLWILFECLANAVVWGFVFGVTILFIVHHSKRFCYTFMCSLLKFVRICLFCSTWSGDDGDQKSVLYYFTQIQTHTTRLRTANYFEIAHYSTVALRTFYPL